MFKCAIGETIHFINIQFRLARLKQGKQKILNN